MASSPPSAMLIVIISDELALLNSLPQGLAHLEPGAQTQVFSALEPAREVLVRQAVDVVVVDEARLQNELEPWLRTQGEALPPVIVVGATSGDATRRRQDLLAAGATNYVPRDLDTSALLHAIVTAARQRSRLATQLEQSRQRAAQVERLRALGELSAGVAHDFNNTLGTILGRVALARDRLERGESVLEDLQVIFLAGRHAADIVARIQEFSRPTGTDTWRDVNLAQVLNEAATFISTQVPAQVQLRVDAGPTPLIRGNPAELREVLLNLLRNALDAVGGRGQIHLRSFREEDRAIVEVRDNGVGMPEKVRKRIFEPFFSTKGERGSGLGLSISHWILRRHDAQIAVDSSPEQGTCFRLTFEPFRAAQAPAQLARDELRDILVVDDEPAVGEMLRDLLSEQGHRVEVVESATAALAVLGQKAFDLLITDLDLADMSGWQLARRVRDTQPTILIGLMTGWPLGASENELHARGVHFVLSKPFSVEALHETLRALQDDKSA